MEEPRELIVKDLGALLQEAGEERGRELQEEQEEVSHHSVVCPYSKLCPIDRRRLKTASQMVPGGRRWEQRASCATPYSRRGSVQISVSLRGPGNPGDQGSSPIASIGQAVDPSLLMGTSSVSTSWTW